MSNAFTMGWCSNKCKIQRRCLKSECKQLFSTANMGEYFCKLHRCKKDDNKTNDDVYTNE